MSPRNPAAPSKKAEQAPPADEATTAAAAVIDAPEPPPNSPASDLLTAEVGRERRLAEAREELLFRRHALLAEGEEPSPDELRLLATAVPRSVSESDHAYRERLNKYLRRQEARVARIVALQVEAGSPSERKVADGLARKTAAELEAKSPTLEEQIRELQKQLDALRLAADNAQTAADVRHAAVAGLHDKRLLPPFVADQLASIERRHSHDFGKELINLEARRTQIEALLALNVTSPEGLQSAKLHVGGNSRFGPDEFERREHMFFCSRTNHGISTSVVTGQIRLDRWATYLADLRDELATVESRISEIAGGPQAAAKLDIDKLRSFYVPL